VRRIDTRATQIERDERDRRIRGERDARSCEKPPSEGVPEASVRLFDVFLTESAKRSLTELTPCAFGLVASDADSNLGAPSPEPVEAESQTVCSASTAAQPRSKGPRFRFLCEEQLKLPKKEQDAALAKWAEKNA